MLTQLGGGLAWRDNRAGVSRLGGTLRIEHEPAAAPLIAVTGRRRSARGVHAGPPSLDRLEIDVYFTGYADQVADAGGTAVYLPSGANPDAVMDRMDGLLLTGGADVDPTRYGATASAGTAALDPPRDALELALLDAALRRGLPVLAICRGLQLVNVSRGGTLHPHLAEHPMGEAHEVRFEAGSALERLYGTRAVVNSVHHQSTDRLGDDLVVTARAADGVVEGLESPALCLLGVQWHPEQMDGAQPVFAWLVDAARRPADGS